MQCILTAVVSARHLLKLSNILRGMGVNRPFHILHFYQLVCCPSWAHFWWLNLQNLIFLFRNLASKILWRSCIWNWRNKRLWKVRVRVLRHFATLSNKKFVFLVAQFYLIKFWSALSTWLKFLLTSSFVGHVALRVMCMLFQVKVAIR